MSNKIVFCVDCRQPKHQGEYLDLERGPVCKDCLKLIAARHMTYEDLQAGIAILLAGTRQPPGPSETK